VQIFYVRGGRIRGQRGWVADRVGGRDTGGWSSDFLLQLYAGESSDAIPREILVPALPDDAATSRSCSRARGGKVSIRVPAARRQEALQETVAATPRSRWRCTRPSAASDLTTRNRALEEIQRRLGWRRRRCASECYDISNLQGTEVVASMVVFEDGLARKGEYRRFVIRGVEGQNDVASMHEVITRRFRPAARRAQRDAPVSTASRSTRATTRAAPMLVDPDTGGRASSPTRPAWWSSTAVHPGGRGTAGPRRARHRRRAGGRSRQAAGGGVAALQDDPVIMPRTSEGLYLLQRVRDEAHRFAITHHRSRRSKSMVESILDDVPGLGEVRRKTLIRHFGSLKKLRAATVEEIAEVPGIGARTATAIADAVAAAPTGRKTVSVNTATGEIEES
jgi:excinuclease ABC subunit C